METDINNTGQIDVDTDMVPVNTIVSVTTLLMVSMRQWLTGTV